jgi:hypothetical protein
MRALILGFAAIAAACSTSPAPAARDSIEVVYNPETMNYTIEDGGAARLVGGGDHPVYEFEASREDYRQIADLLEPLQANGLPCSEPAQNIEPGYIVWRRGGEEVRRVEMHTICYASGPRPLARQSDRAWRLMVEMGHARYVAPPIPEPAIITLQNLYWGNPTSTWTIPRGGEGRFVDRQRTVTFAVSDETFDRIRENFRPYEARDFHCDRVATDGPYGYIIWSSQEGQEDQRTRWDAGCLTGDASDLFARIDAAMEILVPLREAAAQP